MTVCKAHADSGGQVPQLQDSQVKKFWETRAQDQSLTDAEATHSDVWQRWLEIETIKPFLRAIDSLVDVGCGSGYATRLLALDSQALGTFDVALSVRCLINLESWDRQQRAIQNIARLLKPGGRFIFVEGLADGRRNLNAMRTQMGLSEMPAVWHNVDFEESQLMPYLDRFFTLDARRHFGTYDFVSRIVHPMAVAPGQPVYDSPINRTAAQLAVHLQEFAALSRVLFLALTRRP